MTISEAKQKLVAWATAQLGCAEGADNWNKYAQNKTDAYGWNVQNQPWCDVFVDAGFIECFGLDLAARLTYQPKGGFSALCSQSVQYYKNNGAWRTTPESGDQVFFYFSGGINHTGIVTSVSGGVVYTVEGNASDSVRRCAYAVGSACIAGYGRPRWAAAEGAGEDPPPPPEAEKEGQRCSVTVTLPVLSYGDEGEYVMLMQQRLIAKGCSCGPWGADGEYGGGTREALLHFQRENGLEADGVCGRLSWTKLL